jgi:hypothetical protein
MGNYMFYPFGTINALYHPTPGAPVSTVNKELQNIINEKEEKKEDVPVNVIENVGWEPIEKPIEELKECKETTQEVEKLIETEAKKTTETT